MGDRKTLNSQLKTLNSAAFPHPHHEDGDEAESNQQDREQLQCPHEEVIDDLDGGSFYDLVHHHPR